MKLIYALLVIFAVQYICGEAQAGFIGKENIGRCDTISKIVVLPKPKMIEDILADNGLTHQNPDGTYVTYLTKTFFDTLSPFVQKFVFQHECGHAHGIENEYGADAYAAAVMDITKDQAKQICHEGGIAKARCEHLIGIAK